MNSAEDADGSAPEATAAEAERLEAALEAFEAEIDARLKAVKPLVRQLTALKKAAQHGDTSRVGALVEEALEAHRSLGDLLAQTKFSFDVAPYVRTEAYLAEIVTAARRRGLKVHERDGRIYAFPVLVSAAGGTEPAVRIMKRLERKVRPSAVAAQIEKQQKRPVRFKPEGFLEALYQAFRLLRPEWTPEENGALVTLPLVDIYGAMTLLPFSRRDYPLEEFARDIHLLGMRPELKTKDGCSFRLPAAASSRTARRLSVIGEYGQSNDYVSIAFTLDHDRVGS